MINPPDMFFLDDSNINQKLISDCKRTRKIAQIFKEEPVTGLISAFETLGVTNTASILEAKQVKSSSLQPGQRLIQIGDKNRNLYFFSKGLFKIVYCDEFGREFIRAFLQSGMFYVSLSSCLKNCPCNCYLEAIEYCEFEFIDFDLVTRGLDSSLSFNRAWRKYMNSHFIRHERRELELLANNAKQRYLNFLEDNPDLDARLPNKLVASYLGITEQSLSRIRKDLNT